MPLTPRPLVLLLTLSPLVAAACPRDRSIAETTPPPTASAWPPAADAAPLDRSRPPPCFEIGRAESPEADGLQAEILVFACADMPASERLLNARVINRSAAPIRFFRMPTRYPMLVFELRRADGTDVPGGPPPVPPEDNPSWWLDLAPNADYSFDAALMQVVATELPPGAYEIRFAYESRAEGAWMGRLETAWVRFDLPRAP